MFGWKKKTPAPPAYPPEEYEPVIRSSICTGEKVACMRNRQSGRMQEIMLIRTQVELDSFCRQYQLSPDQIKTVY